MPLQPKHSLGFPHFCAGFDLAGALTEARQRPPAWRRDVVLEAEESVGQSWVAAL